MVSTLGCLSGGDGGAREVLGWGGIGGFLIGAEYRVEVEGAYWGFH